MKNEVSMMMIDTSALVSMTQANQNFSQVAKLVDQRGAVVVLKNNAPRYLIIDFSQAEAMQTASDEDLLAVSSRLIEKNRTAYEALAK